MGTRLSHCSRRSASWKSIGVAGEERLAADGVTVRCSQLGDGALPDGDDDAGAVAYIARAY